MGQDLVFADQSGCRILGDHEAGVQAGMFHQEGGESAQGVVDQPFQTAFRNVGDFGDPDAQEVEGQGHGFAVEVPAGDHVTIRQHNGVVGGRIDFNVHFVFHKAQSIFAGPVDLGYAAQAVGILYLQLALMGHIGTAGQQVPHVVGGIQLSSVGADHMEPFIEGIDDSPLGFNGQGSGNIALFQQGHAFPQGKHTHGGQDRGAVDEGQPFFGFQMDDGDAGSFHGFLAGHYCALVFRITQPQHGQDHVGQRRQVTGSPQGTFFRNVGMDPFIDHIHQGLQGGQPDAGIAFHQGVGPDGHGSPGHFPAERFAIAAGMGTDQVFLELGTVFFGDVDPAQGAEPGGNPVNHTVTVDDIIDKSPGGLDPVHSIRIEAQLGIVAADGDQLFQSQIIPVQYDFFNGFYIFQHVIFLLTSEFHGKGLPGSP